MSIESVMLSNHLILCHHLLLLPSVFPSARIFSSELTLHIRWPKYCSFSNRPAKEYLVLIFFRIDWFDLPADQGTLKSLLQHRSSKASILWHLAFFMVLLSHLWASLVAQLVKNPPAMQKTWVQSLVGKIPWRRERLPTPVFWPLEFHGLYSPWGHKELDTAEQLSHTHTHTHTFTYVRDYWKNHSFDNMDLCQESNVSVFYNTV